MITNEPTVKLTLTLLTDLLALRGVHGTAAAAPELKRPDDKPEEEAFMR